MESVASKTERHMAGALKIPSTCHPLSSSQSVRANQRRWAVPGKVEPYGAESLTGCRTGPVGSSVCIRVGSVNSPVGAWMLPAADSYGPSCLDPLS